MINPRGVIKYLKIPKSDLEQKDTYHRSVQEYIAAQPHPLPSSHVFKLPAWISTLHTSGGVMIELRMLVENVSERKHQIIIFPQYEF